MALKLKINLENVPKWGRYAIAIGIPVAIILLYFLFYYKPKQEEITKLKKIVVNQEKEIANAETKLRKLPELKRRYNILKSEFEDLKRQLPEEREISGLLKQVSDLGVESGLIIKYWKPAKKRLHSSRIVYEIPVKVEMMGSYHNLGRFFSSLTTLDRIVNITNIRLANPKPAVDEAVIDIYFNALTFSAVPEEELQKMRAKAKGKKGKKRR
jgi:type IV pilus assembly protein PilO